MSARVLNFKIEKESEIGALYLVKHLPGNVQPTDPLAPALVYLDRLVAASGRRTQRGVLVKVARILTGDPKAGLGDYEWKNLRSGQVEFVIGVMQGEDCAPCFINKTISAMRGVAKWAVHLKQMKRKHYDRLRAVPLVRTRGERRRPARALTLEEIVTLFHSCEVDGSLCALRDAAAIALLYRGGLRLDEARSLELACYNRRRHTLSLSGKGRKRRTVYFDDPGARRALHAWLRRRGEEPGALLCPVDRHGHVRLSPFSQKGLYSAVMRRGRLAGIDSFTVHDLRRSFGTHLRNKGEPLSVIRALLGHSDTRTTEIYLMTEEREKRKASLKIKVAFRPGRGGGGGKRKRSGRRRGSNWKAQLRTKL
jgi:integrase/recombinase XerD